MKLSLIITLATVVASAVGQYQPNWDSIDSRPLPSWYDEAKIGIFIHWGVFSVPGYSSEWFWNTWINGKDQGCVNFMQQNYKPDFTYQDFAAQFSAEFFDPNQWAEIIKASGAGYAVLTSKHHEGYTLWPSKYSWNWNAKDVGPNRDLVGDLAQAIRNTPVRFGLYHSLLEWFHPLYLQDKWNNWATRDFVVQKTFPELIEIVNTYKPDIIWSDGEWEAPDVYFNSTGFIAWLYNESPVKDTVVTNDRWGKDVTCHHGGVITCNDRFDPGTLQPRKWENAMTLDKGSWGYRRTATVADFLTINELLTKLASTVSCGGNILINVGPTPDGRIAPIYEERLRQLGSWLSTNGEAIYKSVPWTSQKDNITDGIWYTKKVNANGDAAYAIVLSWPQGSMLTLGAIKPATGTVITMLGFQTPLSWKLNDQGNLVVTLPNLTPDLSASLQWAWVLKFQAPAVKIFKRQ